MLPPDNLVERHYRREGLSQAPLHDARIDQYEIAHPVVTPLCGLLDDLGGCAVEQHFSQDRRRDGRGVGQGGLLIHIVRQQVLAARKPSAQGVLYTVASEELVGCVQPERPQDFRVECLDARVAEDHHRSHEPSVGDRSHGVYALGPTD